MASPSPPWNQTRGVLLGRAQVGDKRQTQVALSCAVYSRNHCWKRSLLKLPMIRATEVVCYTVISKNEVRIRFKASCLAQWAKRRPTRRECLVALALIYATPPASADICGRQLGGCLVAHLSV